MSIENKGRQSDAEKALFKRRKNADNRHLPMLVSNNVFPAVLEAEQNKAGRLFINGAAVMVAGAFLLAPDYGFAAKRHSKHHSSVRHAGRTTASAGLVNEVERLRLELENTKKENEELKTQIESTNGQAPTGETAETATTPATEGEVAAGSAEAAKAEPEETFTAQAPKALGEVVVNSRRKEEKLQDVPLPISVVGNELTKRDNIVSVSEVTQKVPNLLFTASNSRQTSIAIRGLGKNASDEARDPSVGYQVDNVPVIWPGSAYTNFVDLDHIEFLRGPQGTLQGKNANLGLLNIVTKAPSWKSEYYVEGFAGNRDTLQGKVGASGAILPGLLAYRGSFYIDRRDGFVDNLDGPVTTGKLKETNRLGGRLQLLFTPTETLSARVILDRASATNTQIADYNIADPALFTDSTKRTSYSSRLSRDYFNSNGQTYRPLIGNARQVAFDDIRSSRGDQQGVSTEINWDFSDKAKLTSISAYRYGLFEPHNDGDSSPFAISEVAGGTVRARQWSQELRVTSKEPAFGIADYQFGAFALRTDNNVRSQTAYGADAGAFYATNKQYNQLSGTAVGRQLLRDSLNGTLLTTTADPTVTSLAAFAQTDLHITEKAQLTLGFRHTWEDRSNETNKFYTTPIATSALNVANYAGATQADIDAAIGVRGNGKGGGVLGNVFGKVERQGFDEHSENWVVNPSYKFSKDLMAYFSVSGGQKSGAAIFDANGGFIQLKPEQVIDFELGLKSSWFDKKLFVNLNLYDTQVSDYQAQLLIPDSTQESGWRSQTGNVKGIEMQGIEIDASANPLPGLNLYANGSYNHATYTDFKNAPCPAEFNSAVPCDYTGKDIPNAPNFTVNFGADYRHPLGFLGLEGIVFLTDSYRSSANMNASLSQYGQQKSYHITDGGIGVQTLNGKYNLSLIARNIFDTRFITNAGGISSTGASTGVQGEARYFGVNFRTNF